MSVIALVVILCFLAGVLWFVNTKIPTMNPTIRMLINGTVILIAIILVLAAFGVWQEVKSIRVPQL